MRYVVIMAGGSGKRLWPLSRQGMPKQFLELVGGKSLLRIAYERIQGMVPDAQVLICTGADYLDVVAQQLPELAPQNLLGEPVGRDSLNAVAWPAAVLHAKDPNATIAMLSADQIITPVEAFQAALDEAFQIAESDAHALVTFGVVPNCAHTGFGYLKRGQQLEGRNACWLQEFVEKPNQATAQKYVDSGQYWWNSGMFVWQAKTLLRQLEILNPDTYEACQELAEHPEKLAEIYPNLRKISVDYAVMEPVSQGQGEAQVVAVELPVAFHDMGGFPALLEQMLRDGTNPAFEGAVVDYDSHGNLIINRAGSDHVVAVAGLENMIVVAQPDVTMVCPLNDAQKIKDLVAQVEQNYPKHA